MINLRKAKILGMYAIDISTARPKWRQTPVTAYICLYQELNLKIVEYTYYKLKRCSNKECFKQCRYVMFKGTMTKWPVHISHLLIFSGRIFAYTWSSRFVM